MNCILAPFSLLKKKGILILSLDSLLHDLIDKVVADVTVLGETVYKSITGGIIKIKIIRHDHFCDTF